MAFHYEHKEDQNSTLYFPVQLRQYAFHSGVHNIPVTDLAVTFYNVDLVPCKYVPLVTVSQEKRAFGSSRSNDLLRAKLKKKQ